MKNTHLIRRIREGGRVHSYYGVRDMDWVIRVSINALTAQSVTVLCKLEYENELIKLDSKKLDYFIWREQQHE